MSTNENTAPKADVYRKVTGAIVAAIESGRGHYRMAWTVRQDRGFSRISVGSVSVAA
jgi:antirestriction protein ArdC